MESNAWVVPIVIGLVLDACGAIILVRPLLDFNFFRFKNNQELLEKVYERYDESIEKVKKIPPEASRGTEIALHEVMMSKIFRLEIMIRELYHLRLKKEFSQYHDTIIALIIIITGIILQIIGNVMNQYL